MFPHTHQRVLIPERHRLTSGNLLSPHLFRAGPDRVHVFMENFFQFLVDDTSPTISYSPFRDTLSVPNLSAGWNPYYDQSGFASSIGELGNGTSLHITSLDGASLGFQWHGEFCDQSYSIISLNLSQSQELGFSLRGMLLSHLMQ